MRNENNRHQLNIDSYAANIVREIFRLKMEGMSQQKIADWLNSIGEPSPSEYKRKQGSRYITPFQVYTKALWSAVAVGRILNNPVYIGVLIQGKETTPNYKVKKRIQKSKDEWSIIENAHEPIINKRDFETVNHLLKRDTRTSPKNKKVLPLSGLLYCGDCKNSIIRKKVAQYFYYVCATSKTTKGCTSHTLKPVEIEKTIMEVIVKQISAMLNIESCLKYLSDLSRQHGNINQLSEQYIAREKEIKDCEQYKRSLYEDLKNGYITKDDYIEFGKHYTERISEIKMAMGKLKQELELHSDTTSHAWIEEFKLHRNVTVLSRQIVVNLIARIDVFEDKRISICFCYQDSIVASR